MKTKASAFTAPLMELAYQRVAKAWHHQGIEIQTLWEMRFVHCNQQVERGLAIMRKFLHEWAFDHNCGFNELGGTGLSWKCDRHFLSQRANHENARLGIEAACSRPPQASRDLFLRVFFFSLPTLMGSCWILKSLICLILEGWTKINQTE